MSKLPSLKPRQVISILKQLGFIERNVSGSHHIFRHPGTGKIVSVPIHGGHDLKKGTLRNIIRQAGSTVETFLELA